jgi:hypothetical protein
MVMRVLTEKHDASLLITSLLHHRDLTWLPIPQVHKRITLESTTSIEVAGAAMSIIALERLLVTVVVTFEDSVW